MEALHVPTEDEIGNGLRSRERIHNRAFHDAIRQLAARIQVLEDRTAKMRTPYVPAFVSTALPA